MDKTIQIVFHPVTEWAQLCNVGDSASIPETRPLTFDEAARRSARRNHAALVALSKC